MQSITFKALAVLAVTLLVTPALGARQLQQAVTDADIYNFALNLEYLEANFYHCGAYGTPIPNNGGGPDPTGCHKGTFTDAVQAVYVELARDEMNHVTAIQAALGSAAVPAPQIDLSALSAAANAAANTTLSPPFDYGANDITGLLASFVFEDVGVTAYNGAAPLITDKTLLGSAVSIGLVEAYHAGIIRKTLFDMMDMDTGYGLTVGQVAGAISALRASVGGGNDEGLTTVMDGMTETTIVPTGAYSLAFSRTPAEVLAIVYLGSATTPGGFFPNGLNGSIK